MTFQEAINGSLAPNNIIEDLKLITVKYISFDGLLHQGQILIHKDLTDDLKKVFDYMLLMRFPINKVIPISKYKWNDILSMEDNNTSAFNYRVILGTDRLSNHSFGRAIDINPMLNPYIINENNKLILIPENSSYNIEVPGTLSHDGKVVTFFKSLGWNWLGDREKNPDYQHFDKI